MGAILTGLFLSLAACVATAAQAQVQALSPSTGKYRLCNADVSVCGSNNPCVATLECPKQTDCASRFTKRRCEMRAFGATKLRDPGCVAKVTVSRSACERDQARAIDDCRQKRDAEVADCLVQREAIKADCEGIIRAEAEKCGRRRTREVEQSRPTAAVIGEALQQAQRVRMAPIPDALVGDLHAVFAADLLKSARVIQTRDFTSLTSIFKSRSNYLDELAVRDIPYPNIRSVSATGKYLFIPDHNEAASLREIIRVMTLLELYSRLGTDGFAQAYTLERHVLESYIADRIDTACRRLKCEQERSLDED